MKVKLVTNVLYPPGGMTPAGTVLDVSEERAADWKERGIAESLSPTPQPAKPPPAPAAPTEKPQPKGKK